MKILGINCLNHDAAISVIEDGEILFAAHSERYSRKKNDMLLNNEIFDEALSFGNPDKIAYYERPIVKKTRQLYSGQFKEALSLKNLPASHFNKWLKGHKINYIDHHRSHAAAGYYTSPYKKAAIVVIDGIGEWDVISIWKGEGSNIRKIKSVKYPHSLGLFYSAMTKRLDLKPCEEEYILMGMSAWGEDKISEELYEDFFEQSDILKTKYNMHNGIGDYRSNIAHFDFACSTQVVTEWILEKIFKNVKKIIPDTENIVYMGGVALNCVANSTVLSKIYDNIWIMPNPGDAGSSLGCAAALYGDHLNWKNAFLGTSIDGTYPLKKACDELVNGRIAGVANGRAEFGPRALGNRSLLADPRGDEIKDKVNEIKRRQKFRPFAPAVLEEKAHEIFDMPVDRVPYMQFTAKCKRPDLYPAICHVDNTSRVQTVCESENPGFYSLIKEFYKRTGCPMLLNTSLNIKGQPIVNNENHAREFQEHYGVPVFMRD